MWHKASPWMPWGYCPWFSGTRPHNSSLKGKVVIFVHVKWSYECHVLLVRFLQQNLPVASGWVSTWKYRTTSHFFDHIPDPSHGVWEKIDLLIYETVVRAHPKRANFLGSVVTGDAKDDVEGHMMPVSSIPCNSFGSHALCLLKQGVAFCRPVWHLPTWRAQRSPL